MKIYKYIAKNLDGRTIRGKYEVNNSQELIELLKHKGYYLLSFKEQIHNRFYWRQKEISCESISLFCNQFKTTLQAGLTIIEILQILSFQCENKLLKYNLKHISEEISRGKSLHTSLESCPYRFPSFLCQMVKIGEDNGKLELALEQLSEFYYREHKLRKKIAGAMFYPTIVFVTIVLSIFVLLTTIIPSISSEFISMGIELPTITRLVIELGNKINQNYIMITGSSSLIIILFFLLFRKIRERSIATRIILRVPVIGGIYKSLIEIKLSRALAMILSGGTNILRALEELTEKSHSSYLDEKLKKIIADIRAGYSFSEAMRNVKFFSNFMISLVRIGEEVGKLEAMLEKTSAILDENLQNKIDKITELIQPVMLLIAAVIIGIIVASVMLPIFGMANAIQ